MPCLSWTDTRFCAGKLMFHVRPSTAADLNAIDAVHRAAFPTDLEARLVALLFSREKAVVSLVAEEFDGNGMKQVAGHILFSPVTLEGEVSGVAGLGLAPLAVLPTFQRRGIGSALVRAGIEACRVHGTPFIVVLGEPAFYSRFGFEAASRWKMNGEYGGDDAFQLLPLHPPLFDRGDNARWHMIRYADEFRVVIGG